MIQKQVRLSMVQQHWRIFLNISQDVQIHTLQAGDDFDLHMDAHGMDGYSPVTVRWDTRLANIFFTPITFIDKTDPGCSEDLNRTQTQGATKI